jgi:TonB family protein
MRVNSSACARRRLVSAVVAICIGSGGLSPLTGTFLLAQSAARSEAGASSEAAVEKIDFSPAQRLSGTLPSPAPPNSIGWIEEAIELAVDAAGRVTSVTPFQGAEGSSLVAAAVTDWTFRPALDRGSPVPSRVLVAAIFRPPVLYNEPAPGVAPVTLATPSSDVPVPTEKVAPGYPVRGIADAVVLVEALVGPDGRVHTASVTIGSPGFDDLALTAARGWSFRPARRNGRPVAAFAYLVFGFRRPLAF